MIVCVFRALKRCKKIFRMQLEPSRYLSYWPVPHRGCCFAPLLLRLLPMPAFASDSSRVFIFIVQQPATGAPQQRRRCQGDILNGPGDTSGVAAPASISMPSGCIIWINTNQKYCMKAKLKNIIPFPSNRALVFNACDTGHCLQITSTSCQLNNDCDENNRKLEQYWKLWEPTIGDRGRKLSFRPLLFFDGK